MALEVRRIVTGHDSQGRAVVATDERIAGTGAAGRAGISRVDVWSTDKMPIDNSDAAAELQRKGFVVRHNYVGSGQGSVCRVVEFAPGGAKFMHRTETLDYAICLKGECDLELDDGRTVPMKAGEICGGGVFMHRPPQPRSRCFQQPVLEGQLGHYLLQRAGLPAQFLDLIRGCASRSVTGQALLAGLQKFICPAIIEVLDNPLAAAQLGDTVLAAQTRKDDANLLLCGKLPPGGTTDLSDNLLRRFLCRPGFLSHLRSFNGYDGPEILPSSTRHFCLIGADAGHDGWFAARVDREAEADAGIWRRFGVITPGRARRMVSVHARGGVWADPQCRAAGEFEVVIGADRL